MKRSYALAAFPILMLFCMNTALAQTQYDTSPTGQTGVQVFGSYFAADLDSIGLYNGNINLQIPLFSLPGRELPMSLSLSYTSQEWESRDCGGYPCGQYTGGWKYGSPFGLPNPSYYAQYVSCDNTGVTYQPLYEMNVYWIDGSGAKHRYMGKVYGTSSNSPPYNNCSGPQPAAWAGLTLQTMDSDGSVFYTGDTTTHPFCAYKDGSRLDFQAGRITTANGNYLVNSGTGLPTQDTLGRTIQYSCSLGLGYCGPGGAYNYTEYFTVTDANGVAHSYTVTWATMNVYDPYQQTYGLFIQGITSIGLPNGQSYQFQYNHPQGFLTKVILPSGAYISYVYPGSSQNLQPNYDYVLERHVSADGTTGSEKVWLYQGKVAGGGAQTITVQSPEGNIATHTFNAQGLETLTQAGGETTTSSWSQASVDANAQANNPQINTITRTSGSLQSTRTLTYDTNMNVTQDKLTDWSTGTGPVIKQHDLTYVTISTPNVSNFQRLSTDTLTSGTQQGLTQYFYDEYAFTYTRTGVPNSAGNSSSANLGNLTTIKHFKDATNFVAEHMYYDNVGNVVMKEDPLGHTTTIDYSDNFSDAVNRSTFAYPKTATNPLGQFTTTQYDFNTGLPKQVTNLRGYNTVTTYDLMNRVTSVTEPNTKVTAYSYDDTNRITTKTVTIDSSGNQGRVKTYFDGLYRVTETRTNDPEGEIAVDTVYDGNGRKKQVSSPYRVAGGTQIWTTTTYDGLDRPTQVQAPDGSTVQYAFSNNQTTVTDEAGNARRYTYNVLGQMTEVEEPNPTLATPLATTYGYYVFGPLASSNQSGQTRAFVYNWLGQMTSQTLPESGTTTFVYDAASRMTSKTDARNITTTYTYDNANRPTGETYSDSTPAVASGYDANGYTGLKTSMTDALGSVSYAYDNMNRLTQEQRTLTGITGTFSTGYGYNIKGDLTSMTYPSGRVVNLNYATGGGCCNSRLASVVDQTTGTTINGTMNYNAAGELLNSTLGNGVVQTFGYNNRMQQTSITGTLGSTTLMNISYNYGTGTTNTGRVLARTDAIQPEHSANYSYDSIYRLDAVVAADATASWGMVWTFDIWGNRLTQTPQALATSKVGTQTLGYTNNRNTANTYDAAGNQTNDGAHSYAFSAENQILSMDGGAASYAYDGNGRRMKKVTSTETTYTFYGPGGIISEFTTSNAIASATAATSTDKCFYHTSDKLGSAVLVMNSIGVVIENNRTLPYGEAWLTESTPSTNDKKFTTYQRDQESGLDYAMNRYDSSASGRFTSVDKGKVLVYVPLTLNRYLYATADPINHTDPDGNYGPGVQPPEPPEEGGGGEGAFGFTGQRARPVQQLPAGTDGLGLQSVQKPYGSTMSCNTDAAGLMADVRQNFSSFANLSSGKTLLSQTSVTFLNNTGFGPATISQGASLQILHHTTTFGGFGVTSFSTSVTAVGVTATSFTLTTNDISAVFFPASITFNASNAANGQVTFGIQVNAVLAGGLFGTNSAAFYLGGGNALENTVWTNFLNNVQKDCNK